MTDETIPTDRDVYNAYKTNVRSVFEGAEAKRGSPEYEAGAEATITLVACVLNDLRRVADALDRLAAMHGRNS